MKIYIQHTDLVCVLRCVCDMTLGASRWVDVCFRSYIYMYTFIYTCIYMKIHIQHTNFVCVLWCVCDMTLGASRCVFSIIYMHVHIHIHMYIHINTHTTYRSCSWIGICLCLIMHESCHSSSWHTYGWVMSHLWMSHVTHLSESCDTYKWVVSQILYVDRAVLVLDRMNT